MATKLKCIIIDDELPGLAFLKLVCEQFNELEIVRVFDNPQKFLAEIDSLVFDLVILDIEMPHINGLQLASHLKNKLVIFVTAYDQYAADAFDLNAVDYVRKPLSRDRLQAAVTKAIDRYSLINRNEERTVVLNSEQGRSVFRINEIAIVETADTDSRDKLLTFRNGNTLLLKNISFDDLAETLTSDQFVRINKKSVVSLRVIRSYTHNDVSCELGDSVIRKSLSETYKSNFMKAIKSSGS